MYIDTIPETASYGRRMSHDQGWLDSSDTSNKSRAVALAMVSVPPLGVFGAHRFYVGKFATGLLMLCTAGGAGLWWLYDLVLVAADSFRDSDGRRVSKWDETEPDERREQLVSGLAQEVLDELYALRSEVEELGERIDFAERLLSDPSKRPG